MDNGGTPAVVIRSAPNKPIPAKTILIVEDEKHTRLALHLILRQAGFKVIMTADGQEACEKISRQPLANPISLIITDLKMPRLDGLALIDKLLALNILVPVVLITGYGDKELRRQLVGRGCAGYLDKPFVPAELLAQLARLLKQ